jgi:hypothetical protein
MAGHATHGVLYRYRRDLFQRPGFRKEQSGGRNRRDGPSRGRHNGKERRMSMNRRRRQPLLIDIQEWLGRSGTREFKDLVEMIK